jgi:hypothetical protein
LDSALHVVVIAEEAGEEPAIDPIIETDTNNDAFGR